jgi:protein-disulfide isomerase
MRFAAIAATLILSACVPRVRYENAVSELEQTRLLVLLQQQAMTQLEAEVARLEESCGQPARPAGPPPVQASSYEARDLGIPALMGLSFQQQATAMAVLNTTEAPCKVCKDRGVSAATCLMEEPACLNMPKLAARVASLARRGASSEAMTEALRYEQPWVPVVPGDAPILGNPNAPVTIVMFLEAQCPYCVRGSATAEQAWERYDDQVRLVYKHFPLAFHQEARPAAIAMEAARNQGKFWPYKDSVYARASELRSNPELFHQIADDLGLNMARFQRDLDDPATAARVDADMQQGTSLGVTGTPAFFINGYGLRGAQPIDKFAALIDRELGE